MMNDPKALLKAYELAVNTHCFETVKPFISKDGTFWFNDGSFLGIEQIQGAFEKTWKSIQDEKYWLTDLDWVSYNVCFYTFNWSGLIDGKQSTGCGRGTTVVKKNGNNWQIAHEHLSAKPNKRESI